MTGIWYSDREDLQNQKNYSTQEAAATLVHVNKPMVTADRLKWQINQA